MLVIQLTGNYNFFNLLTMVLCLQILFMLVIQLTGNYNFFNLLTMVLCIAVFDDAHIRWLTSGTRRLGR